MMVVWVDYRASYESRNDAAAGRAIRSLLQALAKAAAIRGFEA